VSQSVAIISNGARTVTWTAQEDLVLQRAVLQVAATTLATEPVNKTSSVSDQITNELLIWNVSTEPCSVELSYPIRKGQNLYFTSPAGGGVCNLIFDPTAFGPDE
jgi:hypothetical protein